MSQVAHGRQCRQLVHHDVGLRCEDGPPHCLTVQRVQDDRLRARFANPGCLVTAAGRARHLVASSSQQRDQSLTQGATRARQKDFHLLLLLVPSLCSRFTVHDEMVRPAVTTSEVAQYNQVSDTPAAGALAGDITTHRTLLFSIAYRMLGTVAEAEDILQEAFLRYHRACQQGAVVDSPKAWLAAVVSRLAIDHLRSARIRRESYVDSGCQNRLSPNQPESRTSIGNGRARCLWPFWYSWRPSLRLSVPFSCSGKSLTTIIPKSRA